MKVFTGFYLPDTRVLYILLVFLSNHQTFLEELGEPDDFALSKWPAGTLFFHYFYVFKNHTKSSSDCSSLSTFTIL